MPFVKGQSGNPSGRSKYAGEWGKAIWKSLEKIDHTNVRPRLELVADRLVDAAIAGDVSAMREIGDRIDGKAVQPIENDIHLTVDVASILDRARKRARLPPPADEEPDPE